jgi:hypothetical protein
MPVINLLPGKNYSISHLLLFLNALISCGIRIFLNAASGQHYPAEVKFTLFPHFF